MKLPVKSSRLLAFGGFLSGWMGIVGGFLDVPPLLGAAAATMLITNMLVMLGDE